MLSLQDLQYHLCSTCCQVPYFSSGFNGRSPFTRFTKTSISNPSYTHTPQDSPPLVQNMLFHSSLLRILKLLTYPSSSPPKFPQNFTSLSQDPPQNFPTRGTQLSSCSCPYKAYLPPPPPRLHLTIHYSPAHSPNFPKLPGCPTPSFRSSTPTPGYTFGLSPTKAIRDQPVPHLYYYSTQLFLSYYSTQLFLTYSTIPN